MYESKVIWINTYYCDSVLSSEPFFFFRIFKVVDDFPIAVTYFYHRTIVANKTWISDMSMNLSNLK